MDEYPDPETFIFNSLKGRGYAFCYMCQARHNYKRSFLSQMFTINGGKYHGEDIAYWCDEHNGSDVPGYDMCNTKTLYNHDLNLRCNRIVLDWYVTNFPEKSLDTPNWEVMHEYVKFYDQLVPTKPAMEYSSSGDLEQWK